MNSNLAANRSGTGSGNNREESAGNPETEPALASPEFTFESMSLKVGDRLQAQLPPAVCAERCFVKLLGFVHGHSLLISRPKTAEGVRPSLMAEDKLLIRYFSGKSAFAFSSSVLCEYKVPYSHVSYLHIAFPQKIQGTIIRKEPRVRAKITTTVAAPSTQPSLNGIITNISASGALLALPRGSTQPGQQIKLDFQLKLHDVDTQLQLKSMVRSIADHDNPSATPMDMIGLEFQELQPHDKMLLQSVVYQKMIEEPQSVI